MQSEVANLLDINLKSKPKMQTCCITNKHPKQIKSNQLGNLQYQVKIQAHENKQQIKENKT